MRGWSIAEFAMIVAIAAVLLYVSVRFLRPAEAQAFQQAEQLRNDLRHMQMLALTWNQPLRLRVTSATRYEVCCLDAALSACTTGAAPCATPVVTDPASGRSFQVDVQSGLSLGGAAAIDFDKLGRPYSGGALASSSTSITIAGASATRSVVVAPITGFPTVQ